MPEEQWVWAPEDRPIHSASPAVLLLSLVTISTVGVALLVRASAAVEFVAISTSLSLPGYKPAAIALVW